MCEENYYGLPPESQKIYETAKETNINNVIVERNSLMSENIKLRTQLQQKENIIKEAREYIKEHLEREYFDYDILEANTIYNRDLYKALQILDKAKNGS